MNGIEHYNTSTRRGSTPQHQHKETISIQHHIVSTLRGFKLKRESNTTTPEQERINTTTPVQRHDQDSTPHHKYFRGIEHRVKGIEHHTAHRKGINIATPAEGKKINSRSTTKKGAQLIYHNAHDKKRHLCLPD